MWGKFIFILFRDEHIIKKEDNESLKFSYIENQLYEPNYFFMNDFTDTGNLIQIFFKNIFIISIL